MNKLSIISIFLLILLQGCSATGPLFEPENPPVENQSLLYIYRPNVEMLWMRTAVIYINDEKLVELPNQGYTSVKLSPGIYRVKQIWEPWPGDFKWLSVPIDVDLTLKAGKTHFLELRVVGYDIYKAEWSLKEVVQLTGQTRISSCKRQKTESEKSSSSFNNERIDDRLAIRISHPIRGLGRSAPLRCAPARLEFAVRPLSGAGPRHGNGIPSGYRRTLRA